MNLILTGVAVLCLGRAVLADQSAWAAKLGMAAGAVLVLGLLAAGVSGGTLILAALALCAVTLLCGRKKQ